jgi:hypothetical protein
MSAVGAWSKYPAIDYVVAGMVGAGYGAARAAGALSPLVALPATARATVYAAFMGAAGAVLAFVVVPAAIVLAVSPGPRLAYVMKTHPHDLRRATVSGGFAAILGLASGLVALALDTGSSGNLPARALVLFAAVVLFAGALRMLTVFAVLLKDIGVDRQDATGSNSMSGPVAVPDPALGESVRPLRAAST